MTNRRNFLKTTALATAGVAFQTFNGKSEEAEIDINSGKVNKPIVLSTWRFGIEAKNSADASRIIKYTLEAGLIRIHAADNKRKLAKYIPFWA